MPTSRPKFEIWLRAIREKTHVKREWFDLFFRFRMELCELISDDVAPTRLCLATTWHQESLWPIARLLYNYLQKKIISGKRSETHIPIIGLLGHVHEIRSFADICATFLKLVLNTLGGTYLLRLNGRKLRRRKSGHTTPSYIEKNV